MSSTELSTEIKDTKEAFQLIKLSPEQINDQWIAVWDAMLASLPPTADVPGEVEKSETLKALLEGRLDCWFLMKGEEVWSVATTCFTKDIVSKDKSMLIYSFLTYKPITNDLWFKIVLNISKYAKQNGCSSITAYSEVQRIIDVIDMLGGKSNFRFLRLEV